MKMIEGACSLQVFCKVMTMPHIEKAKGCRGDASCRGRSTPAGCQNLPAQQLAGTCGLPSAIKRQIVCGYQLQG